MTYPDALRALKDAAYAAVRAALKDPACSEETRGELRWLALDTDNLINRLPAQVKA